MSDVHTLAAGREVLRTQRKALQALREAGQALMRADLDTTEIRKQIRGLQAETILIAIPCLVCSKLAVEMEFRVGDNNTPASGLCGSCNAAATSETVEVHTEEIETP